RSQTLNPLDLLSTSPGQESTSSGSFLSRFKRSKKPSRDLKHRTLSVSSNATTMTMQSTSSSTSDTTVTIGGGNHTRTVLVHTRPTKPMLVLFTRDPKTDHRAIVAVSIDEKTIPSPHKGPDGKLGKLTVLAQAEGKKALEARRLQSQQGQWDLLPLCANRRNERRGFGGAAWRDLNRVSILFLDVDAHFQFGDGFCQCRRQTRGEESECMRRGHVGLLGQVRVYYRNEATRYYDGRYGANVHVSKRSLAGGAPRDTI
ncbi:hypothetical protein IMZ48_10280, partial [Candidatus Bathyarchaeota archaeon]|nr:hypothetical protein [Candidatus Bathyarchaeota archaeon]